MIYERCKCGRMESWSSGMWTPCRSCPDCGSNLASSPDAHEPPKPHNWIVTKVRTDAGLQDLTVCGWCNQRKIDLEEKQ